MTSGRIVVERLRAFDFRNLAAIDLEPAPRLNVIAGDNGQGKTSLIEALYVVATSRSFRSNRLKEVIRHGAEAAKVALSVSYDGLLREQRGRVSVRGRSWLVDGKRSSSLLDYATKTPVVVFHPGDLALVAGSAQGRRTLLDRIALFNDPASADARARYTRGLRSRQRLLEERAGAARQLDALEEVIAEAGARLCTSRQRAAEIVERELHLAFAKLADQKLELGARYVAGGSADAALFREKLGACRDSDRLRRSASFGPHRDDFVLDIDRQPAKHYASQGQQRLLALSLKMAELASVAQASRLEPILLLDDVSSELDPARTGAVYEFLRTSQSQVFVTTTRPELFVTPTLATDARADFVVREGRIFVRSD